MPITADYHLHSCFSGDSDTPMEEMIQKGISLGLTCMCFTEHMDMDYVYSKSEEQGMFELNTDSYLYELATLKSKYEGQIKLLFGVELGVQPHLKKELALYSKSYPFDFIIASSHICNRKDPYYPSFYEGRSDEKAYREYFSSILDNLKAFSNFDVYGHLDYVVRYGKTKDSEYSYEKYKDILDKILETLLEKEKGIELNTGAIGYNLKDLNPCMGIIKRYKELGGEVITIGSDAHNPSAIARGFDRAAEVLIACGFKYYATFENRLTEFHRI
ncbi:MAG: histidinol-phosphatase HisJ family protein [Lachnospiraceae bacterium]|nr:histidinol-phosphatase HisJ family protein [Lachnospiraceae bacterium]